MSNTTIRVGDTTIVPQIVDGYLRSIGEVKIGATALRNPRTRFLPWFDAFEGDTFRSFRFLGIDRDGDRTILRTRAVSDPDQLFRERRDSSGDLCFRAASWDDAPIEADFRVVFAPANATIDGRSFTGFKYHFEYAHDSLAIHRIVDRQTWEVGGNLDDVTICLRNWLTPPRMKIGRETTYSTVGLDQWAALLPGNLWARWTLLPSFDLQYGKSGVTLGWFDQVSLIRTVVESNAGEDALRCLDLHCFEQSKTVATNPKTILWCDDHLDDVESLNLWTRVYDLEQAKSCEQLGINQPEPAAICFGKNIWRGMNFDSSYEDVVEMASDFGADIVFIDSIWEHQQAFKDALDAMLPPEKRKGTVLEKFRYQPNMCITLDFEVTETMGGEKGLKDLVDRAAKKGVKIISWMAAHYSPNSILGEDPAMNHGAFGIYAGRESGRHPDTGAPAACWTANLNNTALFEKLRKQVLGVCERTGLAGYLWDSVSNMGWWQIDYPLGTMRPQFDRMAQLYADLVNSGRYIYPESITMFTNFSCCGMHGGNVYAGDNLGFSYKTCIALNHPSAKAQAEGWEPVANKLFMGEEPFETLFRCYSHLRIPMLDVWEVRDKVDPAAAKRIKELFSVYRKIRGAMKKRTVVKNDAGVMWEGSQGETHFFSYNSQKRDGKWIDVGTNSLVNDGALQPLRVYRLLPNG